MGSFPLADSIIRSISAPAQGWKNVFEVGEVIKGRKQFKGVTADQKIILSDGGKLNRENIPLHCLRFLA